MKQGQNEKLWKKLYYDFLRRGGARGIVTGFLTAFIRPATNSVITQKFPGVNLFQIIDFSILKYGFILQKKNFFLISVLLLYDLLLYEHINFSEYIFSNTNFENVFNMYVLLMMAQLSFHRTAGLPTQ